MSIIDQLIEKASILVAVALALIFVAVVFILDTQDEEDRRRHGKQHAGL